MDTDTKLPFDFMPQDAHSQIVLNARAKLLAKADAHSMNVTTNLDYLLFDLENKAQYGILFNHIYEVMVKVNFTPLPFTPECIAGVTNLRGHIVSIIDLNFLLHQKKSSNSQQAIFVSYHDMLFGILVHNIKGNGAYTQETLDPPLQKYSKMDNEFIMGIDRAEIALLNIDNVIDYLFKIVDSDALQNNIRKIL